jgi:hypothetical protein
MDPPTTNDDEWLQPELNAAGQVKLPVIDTARAEPPWLANPDTSIEPPANSITAGSTWAGVYH